MKSEDTVVNKLEEKLTEIKTREALATKGPWRAAEQGNQYHNTMYMPCAKLCASSVVPELVRPWNPHAYLARGFKPSEFETSRFFSTDARFIAHARTDIPYLVAEIERLLGEKEAWLKERELLLELNDDYMCVNDDCREQRDAECTTCVCKRLL